MGIYSDCSKYFTSPSPILLEDKTISNNIKKVLEDASLYEMDRGDKKKRLAFIQSSTNLFNVFACKYVLQHEVFTNNRQQIINFLAHRCPIYLCEDFHCELLGENPAPSCGKRGLHYNCICPPQKRLPSGLLKFIRCVWLILKFGCIL